MSPINSFMYSLSQFSFGAKYRPLAILFFVIGLCFISSCSREAIYEVDPAFEEYVQRFVDDAAKRGVVIDFSESGLRINFIRSISETAVGVCRGDHLIEIEQEYWKGLNDSQREGLIYHELGHCELNRPHKNAKLKNGEWASRMRGAPIPEGDNAVINYNGLRRTYYIDELFVPETPEPAWSEWADDYLSVPQDQKSILFRLSDTSRFDALVNELFFLKGNFEINVTVNAFQSEGFVGMSVLGPDNNNRIRIAFNHGGNFIVDSGPDVWGVMYYQEKLLQLKGAENKISLRRKGDIYYVFVNEEYVYWFDYKTPGTYFVGSLNTGRAGEPDYKLVEVYGF